MQGLWKGVVCLLMAAGLLVIAPAVSGQELREELTLGQIEALLDNLGDPLRDEIGQTAFSLRGIESMGFVLEELDADAAKAIGLAKQQLRTDVELRLRTAGVKLDDSARSSLYLNVGVLHLDGRATYSIDLEFQQMGTFDGGFRGYGSTWGVSTFGDLGEATAARVIRESVGDLVDEFLNDYLKANSQWGRDRWRRFWVNFQSEIDAGEQDEDEALPVAAVPTDDVELITLAGRMNEILSATLPLPMMLDRETEMYRSYFAVTPDHERIRDRTGIVWENAYRLVKVEEPGSTSIEPFIQRTRTSFCTHPNTRRMLDYFDRIGVHLLTKFTFYASDGAFIGAIDVTLDDCGRNQNRSTNRTVEGNQKEVLKELRREAEAFAAELEESILADLDLPSMIDNVTEVTGMSVTPRADLNGFVFGFDHRLVNITKASELELSGVFSRLMQAQFCSSPNTRFLLDGTAFDVEGLTNVLVHRYVTKDGSPIGNITTTLADCGF